MKGILIDGYVFKQNGEDLTLDEFIEYIESVGLEFGGSSQEIDESGIDNQEQGINFLIQLSVDIKRNKITLEEVKNKWNEYMKFILHEWGFNQTAIQHLIKWGDGGHNWRLLHWDDKKPYQEYLEEFVYEIAYCSDRMTLDRLFRCHWLLNASISNYNNSKEQ
jgi:hypothetical protein